MGSKSGPHRRPQHPRAPREEGRSAPERSRAKVFVQLNVGQLCQKVTLDHTFSRERARRACAKDTPFEASAAAQVLALTAALILAFLLGPNAAVIKERARSGMPKLRKHFYWGDTMRTVADKIPTSDTKAINKECRRQIRVYNYQTRELDDEGFHAAIIPFPVISADAVLTYGLALLYSYELEMWRLEIIEIPDFGQLDHRRRPRAGGRPGGAQRVIIDAMAHVSCFVGDCAQAARAVLLESANLITRSSMSRGLAIFLYDTRTTLSWAQCLALLKSSLGTLRGIRKGLWLYNLWEKPLRNEADVAPLVRTRVNGALDFLGPFWSWEMPRPPYAIFDGLWDASWFGVEQANI